MPFAYFQRLTRRQQGIYLRSEKITQVMLPGAAALRPLVAELGAALESGDRGLTESACQLLAGEIHCHRGGAGSGEPRREVRSAARQLQHVEIVDVSQDAEISFPNREEPPHHVRSGPHLVSRCIGEACVHDRPQRPVQSYLGGSDIGHLIMLGRARPPATSTTGTPDSRDPDVHGPDPEDRAGHPGVGSGGPPMYRDLWCGAQWRCQGNALHTD